MRLKNIFIIVCILKSHLLFSAPCYSAGAVAPYMASMPLQISAKQAALTQKIMDTKTEAQKRLEKLQKINKLNNQIVAVKKSTVVKLKKLSFLSNQHAEQESLKTSTAKQGK